LIDRSDCLIYVTTLPLDAHVAASPATCNLLDSHDNDITYFQERPLSGEGAPAASRHFHPEEAGTLRLTAETRF
jgi:hypothetical protein